MARAPALDWDDLRYVLAVARHGSLLSAARALAVEHTTVGRRVASAERALQTTLFARHQTGLTLTGDGERLLSALTRVEDAIAAAERQAHAVDTSMVGEVVVTAPESFGIGWLAPRLAAFAAHHPGLHVVLEPSGAVKDLSRREAEVALRTFRTRDPAIVARRACDIGYALYASRAFLARAPVRRARDLADRPLLAGPESDREARWLRALTGDVAPRFTCVVAVALVAAARAGAGVAVLPRFLGDAEPELVEVALPDAPPAPYDTLWLTVHKDLRATPRVRAVKEFLVDTLAKEASALRGP